MGVFARNPRTGEEQPGGGGSGLHLDLDERVCPVCRRTFPNWQSTCPDDEATLVTRAELPPLLTPPPPHLLADEE
jgi:predicted amidophosphoribosyltransferase